MSRDRYEALCASDVRHRVIQIRVTEGVTEAEAWNIWRRAMNKALSGHYTVSAARGKARK